MYHPQNPNPQDPFSSLRVSNLILTSIFLLLGLGSLFYVINYPSFGVVFMILALTNSFFSIVFHSISHTSKMSVLRMVWPFVVFVILFSIHLVWDLFWSIQSLSIILSHYYISSYEYAGIAVIAIVNPIMIAHGVTMISYMSKYKNFFRQELIAPILAQQPLIQPPLMSQYATSNQYQGP